LARLLSLPAGRPSDRDLRLIQTLREAVGRLPVPAVSGTSRAEREWVGNQLELQRNILESDPRAFLHWDVIAKTMFVGWSGFVAPELKALKARADWASRWRPAIREARIGRPTRFPLHLSSSANLIHHAYHVSRFEDVAGMRVADFDTIVEFGGGYGSMCRLMSNLGFRGAYTILDLPMFSALQTFYLGSLGLNVNGTPGFREGPAVDAVSDLALGEPRMRSARNGLFVATWSLSETPEEVRERVYPIVAAASSVLIGLQDNFEGIDNVAFFGRWRERLAGVMDFEEHRIPQLPRNRYLFGVARPRVKLAV
jgi:hypothetical protein